MFYQDFSYFFLPFIRCLGPLISQAAWAKDLVAPRRKAPQKWALFRHGGDPNGWIHWIGLGEFFFTRTPP